MQKDEGEDDTKDNSLCMGGRKSINTTLPKNV